MLYFFIDREPPTVPIKAATLMSKYNIPEGKTLGEILKKIEEKWVNNDFKISDKEIQKLIIH